MEIFMPNLHEKSKDLAQTTHLAIAAHQDDIEMMALHGILECFNSETNFFTGIVVTDGMGSTRTGDYCCYTDEMIFRTRKKEQKKAAIIGEYLAQIFLEYSSNEIKYSKKYEAEDEIVKLIEKCRPKYIYTHSLTDKHDTHVAVALAVIKALRKSKNVYNTQVYGCEMWGSLDWLSSKDRIAFDVSNKENLSNALIGIYDSQIDGAKRYDLAIKSRRKSNATFGEATGIDNASALSFAMDLTPLINDSQIDIKDFIMQHILKFQEITIGKIQKFM